MIWSVPLWAVLTPIQFAATLLAYPLVPIAVLFCDANGRLPWVFRWLETPDNLGWTGPQAVPSTAAWYARTPRLGLIMWLWRNRACRVGYWWRARVSPSDARSTWSWWIFSLWRVGAFWEFRPSITIGGTAVFVRCGWKMRPYLNDSFWPSSETSSAGYFTGATPRTDTAG